MKKRVFFALVILLSILLTSCDDTDDNSDDMEMSQIYTAAAMTVTAVAELNPGTSTAEPTASPTEEKEATQTTSPTGSATAAIVAAAVSTSTVCDNATFVADVTIPDGTTFTGGEGFTKTWTVRNTGTCTWTESYALVFSSGSLMNGSTVYLPYEIYPGNTYNFSVYLEAPDEVGSFTGYWKVQNAGGYSFGQKLGVSIAVVEPTETYTPTITSTSPTSTPTATTVYTATSVPTAANTSTPVVVDTSTPVPTEVPTEVLTEVSSIEESGADSDSFSSSDGGESIEE